MAATRGKLGAQSASPSRAAASSPATEASPKSTRPAGTKSSANAVATAIAVNGSRCSGGAIFARLAVRTRVKRPANSAVDAVKLAPLLPSRSEKAQESRIPRWNEMR